MPNEKIKVLTRRQVADILCVTPKTISNWSRRGDFPPPIRICGCIRWRESDVLAFLDRKQRRASF